MANSWIENQTEICDSVSKLRQKYGQSSHGEVKVDAAAIVSALQQFQECVRYLNN